MKQLENVQAISETPNPYATWPRWRFLNLWKKLDGSWTFCVFNIWWADVFCGVTILNLGVEYCRRSEL